MSSINLDIFNSSVTFKQITDYHNYIKENSLPLEIYMFDENEVENFLDEYPFFKLNVRILYEKLKKKYSYSDIDTELNKSVLDDIHRPVGILQFDEEESKDLEDKIIVLKNYKIVSIGSTQKIYTSKDLNSDEKQKLVKFISKIPIYKRKSKFDLKSKRKRIVKELKKHNYKKMYILNEYDSHISNFI
tara:strand:+ start:1498 stop:2061 length:564 start_codon:yes stop_codon:yes gene_type:complete